MDSQHAPGMHKDLLAGTVWGGGSKIKISLSGNKSLMGFVQGSLYLLSQLLQDLSWALLRASELIAGGQGSVSPHRGDSGQVTVLCHILCADPGSQGHLRVLAGVVMPDSRPARCLGSRFPPVSSHMPHPTGFLGLGAVNVAVVLTLGSSGCHSAGSGYSCCLGRLGFHGGGGGWGQV